MTVETVIDAEAVEVTSESTDLAVQAEHSTTLFKKSDPVEALEEASRVATALAGVVKQGGMIDRVQGREYVKVEGWRTLGAILGVSPQEIEMVQLPNGWQCTVEAVTADGRVVGRATSSCTTEEGRWSKAKTFEMQGMASTRATSRALRAPLGFVMQLAGFQATSAEEMSEVKDGNSQPDWKAEAEQFNDGVLPEGQTFPATVHRAEFKSTKNGRRLLMEFVVASASGGKPAREIEWIDPARPEFKQAADVFAGGVYPDFESDDALGWDDKPCTITVSLNGNYRNIKIGAPA